MLTGCSFFTYSAAWPFHETPQIGWAFMMAVSCTKALLVILFFMHVKYEADWKYVLTIPCGCMAIFLACALVPDVGMRNRWASQEALSYMATPDPAEAHGSAQDGNRNRTGQAPLSRGPPRFALSRNAPRRASFGHCRMPSSPAIDISRLSHTYGQRPALSDLSLSIEPGEIFAFLGPNGGGKTTLFRLLSTLIPLRIGSVSILAFDLE